MQNPIQIQYTEYRMPTFLSTSNRRRFTVYFKRPQFRMFKIEVCCTWSQTSLASSSTSNTSSRVKFSWLSGPWLHIFLHTVPKIICYLCIKTKPSTAVANATVYVWFLHQIYFNKSRGHMYIVASSQAVTDSVFMRIFLLFFGTVCSRLYSKITGCWKQATSPSHKCSWVGRKRTRRRRALYTVQYILYSGGMLWQYKFRTIFYRIRLRLNILVTEI